ncbi:hypothetical protein [Bifidobacterium cuniculi]|uniref:Uncharacterized protein n=1 Tax=Bifidobacterium cuniculi TaxID=1688 RepID=A0A087B4C7_9BIFI|nr:hypothetical protein [Bifidobacterium cuniculi]KFI65877.1 hypothetical protein BCUN_0372 [Bifidobacterium cuniculi]
MASYNTETAQIIDADTNLHEYSGGGFISIIDIGERGFVVVGKGCIAPASFDVQKTPEGLVLNWHDATRSGQENERVELDNDDDLRYALCERLGQVASAAYPTVSELCDMMDQQAADGWTFREEDGWIHAEHGGERSHLEASPVYWSDRRWDADRQYMAKMQVIMRYRDDAGWKKSYEFSTAQDAADTIGRLLVDDLADDLADEAA